MSWRAYIVKKYVCEYGGSAFNYASCELYTLLTENEIAVFDNTTSDLPDKWEIRDVTGLKKLVKKLSQLPPGATCEHFSDATFTNSYVVIVLSEWLKHVDKKSKVIRVHWF